MLQRQHYSVNVVRTITAKTFKCTIKKKVRKRERKQKLNNPKHQELNKTTVEKFYKKYATEEKSKEKPPFPFCIEGRIKRKV